VLRALDALGIPLQPSSDQAKSHDVGVVPPAVDINAIVAKARKRKP
jgi:hypothetical protein